MYRLCASEDTGRAVGPYFSVLETTRAGRLRRQMKEKAAHEMDTLLQKMDHGQRGIYRTG